MARPRTRTFFVTGKGGVGKSRVAEALAREGAARGLRVAVVDAVDPGDRGDEPLSQRVEGVETYVLEPRVALRELLARLLRVRALANRLLDSRTFSAVAAAAPGLADLLRMDQLREIAESRRARRLDLVVVNAPATGHGVAMIEAPRRIADLMGRAPGAKVAHAAADFARDASRFRVVVVALPEELAVAETNELHDQLARLDVPVTATVVNGVYPALATAEQAGWLATNPVSHDARVYLARRQRQLALIRAIASPAGEPVTLPYLFDGTRASVNDDARLFDALAKHP